MTIQRMRVAYCISKATREQALAHALAHSSLSLSLTHTHTHTHKCVMVFHNSGFVNGSQCYVIRFTCSGIVLGTVCDNLEAVVLFGGKVIYTCITVFMFLFQIFHC
jgi:hypothetical protein